MVNRCYLCGKEEDSTDHILIHCGFHLLMLCDTFNSLYLMWVGFFLLE